jgi:hypothetical protein
MARYARGQLTVNTSLLTAAELFDTFAADKLAMGFAIKTPSWG